MRKTTLKLALMMVIVLNAAMAVAQSEGHVLLQPTELASNFNFNDTYNIYDFNQSLINSGIPSSQVSFYAQAVNSSTPLVVQNANRVQNPASVIKLVTSYAALKVLGANYQWRTELLSEGEPDAQGILNHPVYLKGSGDPQLVIEKVEELIRGLSTRVKELRAPIIIDRSIFEDEQQDAASFDGAASMPYNAQPDAALINFRVLSFTFNPEIRQVIAVPTLSNYTVTDRVQWIDGACPAGGWKSTIRLNYSAYSATVSGRYYVDCGEQQWHIHAYQMSANDYAQSVLDHLMNGEQIPPFSCGGVDCPPTRVLWDISTVPIPSTRVQDGQVPQNSKVLSSVLSNPLSNILRDMNHFSNNVVARQVYLSLSAKAKGQGSLEGSAKVVKDVLIQEGLSTNSLNMGNGSGLSRATSISAQELGEILVKANSEPALYDSLPIIGISGTVKNRLINDDMVGRGRIKTGTLNDVRAIAGYIEGKSGTRYAIVSIIQGEKAQTAAGKLVHDVFMQWLVSSKAVFVF